MKSIIAFLHRLLGVVSVDEVRQIVRDEIAAYHDRHHTYNSTSNEDIHIEQTQDPSLTDWRKSRKIETR